MGSKPTRRLDYAILKFTSSAPALDYAIVKFCRPHTHDNGMRNAYYVIANFRTGEWTQLVWVFPVVINFSVLGVATPSRRIG